MPSKRLFDLAVSFVLGLVFLLPMVLVGILVKLTSRGGALYWSSRVGKNNALFWMPKFRTMQANAPVVATHLLSQPDHYLTRVGRLLRKASFDELPQFWNILRGDMSMVGPRPALYNQEDLIALRTARAVHWLQPGLTGWAQIHGRDALSIEQKVRYDAEYARRQSFWFDLEILVVSVWQVVWAKGVKH